MVEGGNCGGNNTGGLGSFCGAGKQTKFDEESECNAQRSSCLGSEGFEETCSSYEEIEEIA